MSKSPGSLVARLRLSNPEDCAKLALSNLIVDCGESTTNESEFKIENIDIDTLIKNSEIIMKSDLSRLLRDIVPDLNAFLTTVECIGDVCIISIYVCHYVLSNNEITPLGTS